MAMRVSRPSNPQMRWTIGFATMANGVCSSSEAHGCAAKDESPSCQDSVSAEIHKQRERIVQLGKCFLQQMSIAQIDLAQCGKYAQVVKKIYLDLEGVIPNLPPVVTHAPRPALVLPPRRRSPAAVK
jgi:hypothetical protein